MTNLEALQLASEEERRYYVYVRFYQADNGERLPFYVGKGSGRRHKARSPRSNAVIEFISQHEWFPQLLAINLTETLAYIVEEKVKEGFLERGIHLIDGEHDRNQRKEAVLEGINAMSTENGKRISAKTGRTYGRQVKCSDNEFMEVYRTYMNNSRTISECCRELGVSRSTWYNMVRRSIS